MNREDYALTATSVVQNSDIAAGSRMVKDFMLQHFEPSSVIDVLAEQGINENNFDKNLLDICHNPVLEDIKKAKILLNYNLSQKSGDIVCEDRKQIINLMGINILQI